jgi:hypothetical protein
MAERLTSRLLILPREQRVGFLLLAMPDATLRRAGRKIGMSFPGYRMEKVPGRALTSALAEVYESSARDARVIDQMVEERCPLPPLVPEGLIPRGRIPSAEVELMVRLAAIMPSAAFSPLLWRLLGHPVESVRRAAAAAFLEHAELLDAIAGVAETAPESRPGPDRGASQVTVPSRSARRKPSGWRARSRRCGRI